MEIVRIRTKIVILVAAALIAAAAGKDFLLQRKFDLDIEPSNSFSYTRRLSYYEPLLEGTAADSEIYFFDSGKPGGTLYIQGGTHPNESAGIISAILAIENLELDSGRVIILPVANRSALTCTLPGYGYMDFFRIGEKTFPVGSRVANPLDQWPDPPIYIHYPSGQGLSYEDARNLNRNFPGRKGSLIEITCSAIMQLLEQENVDWAFDLHEASITYPTNYCYIAPEKSADIAMLASMMLADAGIPIRTEFSEMSLMGYTHKEWAEIEGVYPFLIEAPTPVIDRTPGAMTETLLLSGKDEFLLRMAEKGYTTIPYDKDGYSLDFRCGLHLEAVGKAMEIAAMLYPEKAVGYSLPGMSDILDRGLQYYL